MFYSKFSISANSKFHNCIIMNTFGWFTQFLLPSSMDDLRRVLALITDKDLRPKKTLLLRAIEREISEAIITEKLLEIFERVEQLDKTEGIAVMESMKAAYCAVAVECTVKYLAVEDIDNHGRYFDAVERIWRGRVTELERLGNSELVSRELKAWKNKVEAALCDKNAWKKLGNMNTRYKALKLTGDYLGEGEIGSCGISNGHKQSTLPSSSRRGENLKTFVFPRCKPLASHRRAGGRAKTIHYEDMEDDSSFGKFTRLNTPEVNQFHFVYSENFKASVFPRCKPPESVTRDLAEKNKTHEHSFEDRNDADAANSATYWEWNDDDSIDGSPEKNHSRKLHLDLPSLKRKVISPLKKYEKTKIVRRRNNKKWSLLETDTLRNAVQKFGKGNWKFILNSYHDIFDERTGVDLKDKWRNMTRHS